MATEAIVAEALRRMMHAAFQAAWDAYPKSNGLFAACEPDAVQRVADMKGLPFSRVVLMAGTAHFASR